MKTPKVLIACEFSGVVREAFRAFGYDAISCDIIPPEDGRVDYHYQGDVRDILNDGWDIMIGFPPCTYLANSGVRWLYNPDGSKDQGRWDCMRRGALFFKMLLDAKIPKIALENPIQHKYAREIIGRKYDQIIQPWQFGHGETKATCLWLKNLQPLLPTKVVSGRKQRVHLLPPSENRWIERSRTLPGIAMAMAEAWAIGEYA